MSLFNLVPTPIFTGRTFKFILSSSYAPIVIRKLRARFLSSNRGSFPQKAFTNVLKAAWIRRLNSRPGNTTWTVFDRVVNSYGFPTILDPFIQMCPKDNLLRISNDVTIDVQFSPALQGSVMTYINSGALQNDLDTILAWLDLNGLLRYFKTLGYQIDLTNQFNYNIQQYASMTKVAAVPAVGITPLVPAFNSYSIFLTSSSISASYTNLFLFLFTPTLLSNQADWNLICNLKYQVTGITSAVWTSSLDELLQWFIQGRSEIKKPQPTNPPKQGGQRPNPNPVKSGNPNSGPNPSSSGIYSALDSLSNRAKPLDFKNDGFSLKLYYLKILDKLTSLLEKNLISKSDFLDLKNDLNSFIIPNL